MAGVVSSPVIAMGAILLIVWSWYGITPLPVAPANRVPHTTVFKWPMKRVRFPHQHATSYTVADEENGAWLEMHLSLHAPASPTRIVVIIAMGGGYKNFVDFPVPPLQNALLPRGIDVAVLRYTLPHGAPNVAAPVEDLRRAIRYVRELHPLGKVRVGALGLSAGGHLVAWGVSQMAPKERPDLQLLFCPVITFEGELAEGGTMSNLLGQYPTTEQRRFVSADLHVDAQSPPAFLVHARDDETVSIEHSRRMVAALRKAKVAVEMHEMPSGGHALNWCKGLVWDTAVNRMLQWIGTT